MKIPIKTDGLSNKNCQIINKIHPNIIKYFYLKYNNQIHLIFIIVIIIIK